MSENFEVNDEVTIIEELLTDMLQLVHGTLKKLIPVESNGEEESNEETNTTLTASGSNEVDTRNAILKKGTPGGLGGFMAVLTTMQSTVEKPPQMEESSSESSLDGNDEDFEVKLDDYGVPLQLVYHLLVRNSELSDADMRYYLLDSVRMLSLQCDVLSSVVRKHRKFINWCQESLLTGILWQLLESTHSQVAQVAVPLIMHSVGLPGGSDVLWKALDDDFHSDDWRTRYAAVEKVTVIFRFLPDTKKKCSAAVKSVLSHAFCCLIACMDDLTPQVSQQSTLFLGTIHDSALRNLIGCLEYQFDSVPIDRPVILKRLYQLFNCLVDRKVITWPFFVARFEVIVNEIQNYTVHQRHLHESSLAQNSKEAATGKDSPGSHGGVDKVGPKKKHPTETIRSLSANLKYPYKRTVSAPAGMGLSAKASNVSAPHLSSASHQYAFTSSSRQQSAPILKNKICLSKQVSNVATVMEDLEVHNNIAAKTVDIDEMSKVSIPAVLFGAKFCSSILKICLFSM
jgi:hypothetical protein